MEKSKYIRKYGVKAYERHLEVKRQWVERNPKKQQEAIRQWTTRNPDKVRAHGEEISHKGGKYYAATLSYKTSGVQGSRNKIRSRDGNRYRSYKQIIAPDSQIHHEWIQETADYRGVALVEKEQHMHGFIDVIQILEGEITLLMDIYLSSSK